MKQMDGENGQALIIVALSLSLILGFVALAADVGSLFHAKRNLQIAADSAAIAGASELNSSLAVSDVQAAAQAAASSNGVVNGANGAVVTVNSPPQMGPHAGASGYVEAIVSEDEPVFFMRLFNWTTMTVRARAVATNGAPGTACVYVLNSSADDAMDLQGSFNVQVPGCGIVVDSTSSSALNFTGGGGTLTAQSIAVVGGASGKTGDSTPAPVTGTAPESDPLATMQPPSYSPSSCVVPPTSGALGPSTAGGTVCYSPAKAGGTITISNTTLNPGVYVLDGNVSLTGTVSGTGVTLYLLGSLTAANGTLNLIAPTTGAYQGILLFAARGNTNTIMFDFGSASGLLKGIIYAPSSELALHDSGGDKNGGLQLITDLIVNTLYDQTATLTLTSYTQSGNASPLTSVRLVE